MPQIWPRVIPTGGAIGMMMELAAGAWTLERATMGDGGLSDFVQIDGGTMPARGQWYHLDVGDLMPSPLPPTVLYVYRVTDSSGVATTPPLQPVAGVNLLQDEMTGTLIRLMQGGFNSLTLPPGIKKAQAGHALPLTGFPPMPFVVVYPELLGQEEVPIGKDVINPDSNNIAVNSEMAHRIYRVSILAQDPITREFYRDAIIAFFKVWLATFLREISQDVRQRYIATSYQVSGENQSMSPGFYGCDIALEITGVYNIAIMTSYGVIRTVTADVWANGFDVEPVDIQAQVPTEDGD